MLWMLSQPLSGTGSTPQRFADRIGLKGALDPETLMGLNR
jgi:hypothetical protein